MLCGLLDLLNPLSGRVPIKLGFVPAGRSFFVEYLGPAQRSGWNRLSGGSILLRSRWRLARVWPLRALRRCVSERRLWTDSTQTFGPWRARSIQHSALPCLLLEDRKMPVARGCRAMPVPSADSQFAVASILPPQRVSAMTGRAAATCPSRKGGFGQETLFFRPNDTLQLWARFRAEGPKRCRCHVRCSQNPTTAPEALTLPGLQQRPNEIAGYSDCR